MEQIPWLVERLCVVPDEFRNYAVTRDDAARLFGLSAELVDALIAAGLPHGDVGESARFDHLDLTNVAMHLDTLSVQRMAMRMWRNTLRSCRPGDRFTVQVFAATPAELPQERFTCEVALPSGITEVTINAPTDPLAIIEFAARGPIPPVPPEAINLLREAESIDFFILPHKMEARTPDVERYRMGSCRTSAFWIVDELAHVGVEARVMFGLLVAVPYSSVNYWLEVRSRDEWVPVQPVIAASIERWTGQGGVASPAEVPLGALLCALSVDEPPVVTVGGAPVETTYPTEKQVLRV